MKTIKLKYCDWYEGFNEKEYWITTLLEKHYRLDFSEDPDYVFFSVWGTEHLKYDCIKVFYTAEDISPDFNLCDYAFGFDPMVFGDRYLRFSYLVSGERMAPALQKHFFSEEDLKKKTSFCDYIVSNGNGDPIRTDVFHKLCEYKRVDSGGRYLNNIGGRVKNKRAFQEIRKFSIAFENGAQPGYTTEKIIDAFAAKTIPIYWGNPLITQDFNPKSFINYWDFCDLDAMLQEIIRIDQDDALYRNMLSEPIFPNGILPDAYRLETAERFLIHICEQPISEASRRCMNTWRGHYVQDRKEWKAIIDKSQKLLPRLANKLTK